MAFTPPEIAYLRGQRIGRLATIGPHGEPQTRPVAFFLDADRGTIDVGGRHMADTQKYRNVRRNPRVSFLVDDLAPGKGWNPRALEIRGHAETLEGQPPLLPGFDGAVIRIHSDRVLSWGLEESPS